MEAPPDAASPSRWISKYLNTRYFRFPEGVTVRARESWEYPRENKDVNTQLRHLHGQERYLELHKETSGVVPLAGAVAHWWILKDEPALCSNSGYVESTGHTAALYGDELYEMATGRSGHSRLQQLGIIFGQRQVVIYVQPTAATDRRITTNTARTQLLLNAAPLPWVEWAAEFRERIPDEILELMDKIATKAAGSDHGRSIRERLKALMDLYRVSRYKPSRDGALRIGDAHPTAGGQTGQAGCGGTRAQGSKSAGTQGGGPVGGIYSAFLKDSGAPGMQVKPDLFPRVTWVSSKDRTREPGDIEDKAARYLAETHMLLINADFRVFVDMINHWTERYAYERGETAGLRQMITDSVHEWYEQALIECVIGVQALKGSREWPINEIDAALSEEALTAVVMQRYHPYNSVKRELGTKIAPLKRSA